MGGHGGPRKSAAVAGTDDRLADARTLMKALDAERPADKPVLLTYGTKRWDAFTRFLDDGRLEIDNNIAERAIRPTAIGRKNWLFAGSQTGGERAAAIYSVIETAKLNGLEPEVYIADVITKIAADWSASRWDELMP